MNSGLIEYQIVPANVIMLKYDAVGQIDERTYTFGINWTVHDGNTYLKPLQGGTYRAPSVLEAPWKAKPGIAPIEL